MITIYKDHDDYYDAQLQRLGGAKAAYDYIAQYYKAVGVFVEEKSSTTRDDYFDGMHEEVWCWKTVTDLIISVTGESLCQYVVTEERSWAGDNEFELFSGNSKYIVIKNKEEWKAPAKEAVTAVKAQNAQVMIGLGLTNQELNEKYHFKYVDENRTMWTIYGGGELLGTKLYLDQKELGSLMELSSEPMKMLPLRNALNKTLKKDYICQCASELGLSKDGREVYRQMVFLAEKDRFNTKDNHTKAATSVLTVAKMQDIASGRVIVRVCFKQKNSDLELRVY